MSCRTRTIVSWSTGKDSAWSLYQLKSAKELEVVGLFSTVNQAYRRVAMHAVSVPLLRAQAGAIGLPLEELNIPDPCSDEQYGEVMAGSLSEVTAKGVEAVAFGDLFLEDVRRYREERMRPSGIRPIFPLWGSATDRLALEMIDHGFRMVVTCVDPRCVPKELAGREYDRDFLNALPADADPCGENGEFHTFVFDGPIFKEKLQVEVGEIVDRDGFVFADIVERPCETDAHQSGRGEGSTAPPLGSPFDWPDF
jgi:uncharacterized protein (TIGR00290 family)